MNYICMDCQVWFCDTDQNISQQKFKQCPACGSEDIKEKREYYEYIHCQALQNYSTSD